MTDKNPNVRFVMDTETDWLAGTVTVSGLEVMNPVVDRYYVDRGIERLDYLGGGSAFAHRGPACYELTIKATGIHEFSETRKLRRGPRLWRAMRASLKGGLR